MRRTSKKDRWHVGYDFFEQTIPMPERMDRPSMECPAENRNNPSVCIDRLFSNRYTYNIEIKLYGFDAEPIRKNGGDPHEQFL